MGLMNEWGILEVDIQNNFALCLVTLNNFSFSLFTTE
jgi:hypothetical protein